MKKKLAENTEEFDRRFDDDEDVHDLNDRGKPRQFDTERDLCTTS